MDIEQLEVTGNDEPEGFYQMYEPRETLGAGLQSVVRRCINKETNNEYAVKIVDKYSEKGEDMKGIDIVSQVRAEIAALGTVAGHPNIIKLVDVFESSAFFFLIFELAEGGELFDYLTEVVTVPEKETRKFIFQILGAVAHMHKSNIVHRDLKLENILLREHHRLVISDFGFAVTFNDGDILRELCGTPGYLAPEVLKCSMYADMPGYGREVDLWACGVILYTLLVGFAPFWHRRQITMLRNIMEGKYTFGSPEWDDISEGPKDLIRRLLVTNPQNRLTAEQALLHPWFEGLTEQPPRKKIRRRFKAVVVAILTMKELYYTYHLRHQPMTKEAATKDPYGFKPIRRLIDGCAFRMYSHWVQRSNDQVQNRAALFENTPKRELKEAGEGAGPVYLYQLNSPWIKKATSYRQVKFQIPSP